MMLALSPIDTWFFRDATPFTKDTSPQAGVVGVFPPYPPTVVGAIRAELARAQGWNGYGRWPAALTRVLGDGPDELGALRFTGPFVLRDGAPIFPMPLHVVGKTEHDGWRAAALLRPGSEVRCDLGMRPLPAGTTERLRANHDAWVTLEGLQLIARGEIPDQKHIVLASTLWTGEPRIGIERDAVQRSTKEGAMYSTRHIRPARGTAIGIQIDGIPPGWRIPPDTLLPLGGESRLASCALWDKPIELEPADVALGSTIALIALTPLILKHDVLRGDAKLPELDECVVAACVDRPLRVGGWDSANHTPLPLRNALAAGTTLFCTIRDPKPFRSGLVHVGAAQNGGFGLCAVGRLPPEETK